MYSQWITPFRFFHGREYLSCYAISFSLQAEGQTFMGKRTAATTTGAPQRREAALQARWAAGEWRGQRLRASDGGCYTLLYQGRPGGGAGPDFRDAVLACAGHTDATNAKADHLKGISVPEANIDSNTERVYGDIELHLRAGDWRAHGHERDPRYNNLALHVIFDDALANAPNPHNPHNPARRQLCTSSKPMPPQTTILASGRRIPQARLTTQPARTSDSIAPTMDWPCASFTTRLKPMARRELLLAAGIARFEEKANRLLNELRMAGAITYAQGPPDRRTLSNLWPNRRQLCNGAEQLMNAQPTDTGWSQADRVLWLSLAEGLGYGRDRAALRALGEALLPSSDDQNTPHRVCWDGSVALQRVERLRLRGLLAWRLRWQTIGPWAALRLTLEGKENNPHNEEGGASLDDRAVKRLFAALSVEGGAVSRGRAIILAANVALPFAAAWAGATGEGALAALARTVYLALPGAPSNQITREMARQLGLPHAPAGAAAQQGLHHIWATHCRMKRCARCPCAKPCSANDQCDGRIITTT